MPQFTKHAISEAFFRIAAKRPPEKITVKDIVEECGVTRNTFYYYFRDVYDVIEDAFLTIAAGIEHTCPEDRLSHALLGLADFLYVNRAAMRNICASVGGDTVVSYLSRAVEQQIYTVVRHACGRRNVEEADLRLISTLIRQSLLGLLMDWLQGNSEEHPKELLSRIAYLEDGVVDRLLENAETYRSR